MKKKEEQVGQDNQPRQMEKRERATLDFSPDELYYLVGSLALMAHKLKNGDPKTNAHSIKAEKYLSLMRRIDFEFARLHIEQKGDINKFQYQEGEWSLAK